jgi:Alginate export
LHRIKIINMNRSIALTVIAGIIISNTLFSPVFAQDTLGEELKINLQIRPRAEFRNGLFTPILKGQDPASFIGQRSRIGFNYSKDNKLKVGLTTQVVTTWGNDPQVQATANDVSLFEAWAQLYFSPEWNIKVGRQVLSYDDERILGALDWNNAARKHDAALLGFDNQKFKADLAFAFNQNNERVTGNFFNNSLSQPYKNMQFLWMKYKFTPAVALSALAMNLDFQNVVDSSVSHLQTLGGNLYIKKGKWNALATYYYQTGHAPGKIGPTVTTGAWMASAKVDYSINSALTAGVGSDYLSGRDMDATSPNIHWFNPLYGTHHKFYGFMDYFYVSSPHNNTGIWDSYFNINLKASVNTGFQLALHHFEAAAKVVKYEGSKAPSALGNEVDLTFNHKIMNGVSILGGYSQMFTSNSMKYVKNIGADQTMKPVQNWVWLSLNITPEINIFKNKGR